MGWKTSYVVSSPLALAAGSKTKVIANTYTGSIYYSERVSYAVMTAECTGSSDAEWVIKYNNLELRGTNANTSRTFSASDINTLLYPLGGNFSQRENHFTVFVSKGTVNFTKIEVDAGTMPAPDPNPDINSTSVFGHHSLPLLVTAGVTYNVVAEITDSDGQRDAGASGTAHLQTSGAGTSSAYDGLNINGASAEVTAVTFANGIASFTVSFTSAISSGSFFSVVVNKVAGDTLTPSAGRQYVALAPDTAVTLEGSVAPASTARLVFTVQPPTTVETGTVFSPNVQVTVQNANGSTNTSWTSDVVLTAKDTSGTDVTANLGGTKTVAAAAGVASFSTLFGTKPGYMILHAESKSGSTALTGVSTLILVTGPGTEGEATELRQNIRDDGTTWVKTTNVTSPTYGTFTDANKSTLDGDEAVSATVTFDGARWKFPYTLKAVLVRFKVALSSLTSAPTIELYSSQDTSNGQDGTWTLVTSMTPSSTNVFIGQFLLSPAIFAKGLWLTLNDKGGPATANWYSTQIMGRYLGSAISYVSLSAADIVGENYISIPSPPKVIAGAGTHDRIIQLRNNTSNTYQLSITGEPARSTGDTVMDSDNFFIYDENGNEIGDDFLLSPYGTRPLTLRYTITAAANDKSKDHYARVSVVERGLTGFLFAGDDSQGSNTWQMRTRTINTGTVLTTHTLGARTLKSLWFWTTKRWLFMAGPDITNPNAMIQRRTMKTDGTIDTAAGTTDYSILTWSGSQEDHISGIGVVNDKMLLSLDDSTTIIKPPVNASALTNGAPSNTRADCTTFTIPAQTTGAKFFYPGPDSNIAIQNGTAVNSKVYIINEVGSLVATIDPTTPFSGRGLGTVLWDSINQEMYLISLLSAGSRIVARYKKDGTLITSLASTTESTLEATGALLLYPYIVIAYGGRKVYRHDLQSMANATQLFDAGATDVWTPGQIRMGL